MLNAVVLASIASLGFVLIGFLVLCLHGISLGPSDNSEGREIAGSVAFRVAAIYSLVLGLVFSSVNSHFSNAQQNVQEQAIAIGQTFVLLDKFGGDQAKLAQSGLVKLVRESVVELGGGAAWIDPLSPTAELMLNVQLASVGLVAQTETQRELRAAILRRLAVLGNLRAKRFTAEWGTATPGFWAFFLVGFCCIAFCFGAFASTLRRQIYVGLFFAFVGLTSFFVYGLSNPYEAPIRVSKVAFESVQQFMFRVTE